MKQLTYLKKNTLRWRDVPDPERQSPHDAIVRPLAAARCDADKIFLFNDITRLMQLGVAVHYLDPTTIDLWGKRPFQGPIPVGHECVAEVMTCGEEVTKFKHGDRVIVPWAISCGSCSHCLTGLTSKCTEAGDTLVSAYGFGEALGPWGGMVSDLVRVPYADAMLVPLPAGIDPAAVASASDNIPDAWRTVAPLLKKLPGAPVLVVGGAAPSIGLYATAIAIALGSLQVDYVDHNPERLEIAQSLGANPISIPTNKRRRRRWYRQQAPRRNGAHPISVDTTADPDGLRFAVRSLAPGGTCTSVGFYHRKGTSLPLMQMYTNDSTLRTGISHPRADLPAVLKLIASREFRPEKITTVLADWDNAHEAYLERTTKVVVHRPSVL